MAANIDGTAYATAGATSVNLSVTTTSQPGVIVVCTQTDDGTGTGAPTAAGLTFTSRQGPVSGTAVQLNTWTAPYSSNTTFSITVPTLSGASHFIEATGFGVSGTGGTFDANASIPKYQQTATISYTTNTAGDFVFVNGRDTANSTNTAAGWTRVHAATGGGQDCFWQIQSSAGASSFTMDAGTNTSPGCTADALTPSVASGRLWRDGRGDGMGSGGPFFQNPIG